MTGTAGRMGVGAGSITVSGSGLHHRLYDDTGRKEEIRIMGAMIRLFMTVRQYLFNPLMSIYTF
jgi:hypothetical protein